MRILHLSQYFPPEPGAVQVRAHALASNLVRRGNHVTVLTEMPNHPAGVVHEGYRGKFLVREQLDGIDVVRVWVMASPSKTFSTRMAFYLTYMVNAMWRGFFLRGPYDVIFANTPPLFVAAAALVLSYLRRTPLVLEIQDLWPESAVQMGELNNRRFIRWASWLEERCYARARRIVVVTEGIRDRLLERGIPAARLALIENGSNTDLFYPRPAEGARLRADWGLDGKTVVMYAGIIGLAQGLETVVEAARLLADRPEVHFMLIGDGPRREAIERLIAQRGLPNISFVSSRPLEEMPAYLSAADIALVPLRDLELFRGARPTKMFDAWACARPTVVSIRGEAQRVLEEAQAGLAVDPEDPAAIAEAILKMHGDPDFRRRAGENGRRYVQLHYSLPAAAVQLEKVLANVK